MVLGQRNTGSEFAERWLSLSGQLALPGQNIHERISDHAKSISITAKSYYEKQVRFSPRGQAEFEVVSSAIHEVLSITERCFCQDDLLLAGQAEPLEQVVDTCATA